MYILSLKVSPSTWQGETTYRVYRKNEKGRWERVDRTTHKTEADARALYRWYVERGEAVFVS